ncbi:hypothetical protein LPW11_18735 [Geomonas sp. RF6]|uniref:hypothetical protein n=1 Tax=Geomonas sp. RF6 TaxID=2897342 RepID=UPI001E3C3D31|nr:hypothetical protein [Geomonas sp. RF6]UFS69910.1 hypothetical protein LPW11_18735 [Geomonas sp. RF6]
MKRAIPFGVVFGTVANAYAAAEPDDGSGIFVWAFLGFCALIIVVQVIPAVLVMFGIAKGIAGKPQPVEEKTTTTMGSE